VRGSHRYGVPQDVYEIRNAYSDPPTDTVRCLECGMLMTVEVARNTAPEHMIPGTVFLCDGSGARIKRSNGRAEVK